MATEKLIIRITLTKVEKRPYVSMFGGAKYSSRYGNPHLRRTEESVCLYCEGQTEEGTKVHFFTPQAIIAHTTGMLIYDKLEKNTGNFFTEENGEMEGIYCQDVPKLSVIQDNTKIVMAVKVGDFVSLEYRDSEIKFDQLRLKVVRLVRNIPLSSKL